VGKIVDPLAREDGELEPDFSEQRPSEGRQSIDEASGEGDTSDEASASRGAKVRERLLLRAEEARRDVEPVEPAPGDDLDEIGRRATELAKSGDDPATRRAPGAPAQRSQLSPTVVALFGTLMGMAVVASVAAIAMRLSPREREPVQAPSSAPTLAPAPAFTAPAPKPKKRQRQRLPGPYRVAEGANDPALRLVEGKVGTEPFIRALGAAGVPEKETYRVVTAFQGIRSFSFRSFCSSSLRSRFRLSPSAPRLSSPAAAAVRIAASGSPALSARMISTSSAVSCSAFSS